MKRKIVFVVSACLLLVMVLANTIKAEQENKGKLSKADVVQKTQKLQMPFIANEGQTDEKVAFYSNTFGGAVFVTKDGEIVYSLLGRSDGKETKAWGQGSRGRKTGYVPRLPGNIIQSKSEILDLFLISCSEPISKIVSPDTDSIISLSTLSTILNPKSEMKSVALKEELVGGKINEIKGEVQSVTNVNYFKGKDPTQWKTNISTYEVVSLGEVYEGIGLRLKAYGNNVEKLFTVKPEANPNQIKVKLSVAMDLKVNDAGELEIRTELGLVKFTKPVAYQEIDGKRVEVGVEYDIQSSGVSSQGSVSGCEKPDISKPKSAIQNLKSVYGFKVASYDRTKDLIIDPLLASTYLGGTHNETGYSIILDTSGNVYVTGYTKSRDFPTTDGAYDTYGYSGPSYDVFVSKLDSGLTSLLASTYLGGALNDYGLSLALDTSGNVYVMGYTEGGFPTTDDAFDTDFNGYDSYDVFVSKLDSGLTSLLASTYLGGSGRDDGESLALDTSGNVYVTGVTEGGFPTTAGAYDTSFNGGDADVFVSKLDSGLTSLLASTYMGGSDSEGGFFIALDTSGNVYVTGNTWSSDFPTTGGAYDTSRNSSNDVFVSKLDSGLKNLLASTFLGGSDRDYGNSLVFDTSGNVYVTGNTYSSDFPTTGGAYDTSFNGGYKDVFVSKLDSGLTTLLASTYLGGSNSEGGISLALDTSGNVYVTGNTWSSDFPTTSGAYDTSYNGGDYDVFVSKLNGGLTNLLASTYLGGGSGYALGNDSGYSLSLDTSGNVYVTGDTSSSDFPTTGGAYDTSYNTGYFGYYDAFVSKFDSNLSATSPKPTPVPSPTPKITPTPGATGDISGRVANAATGTGIADANVAYGTSPQNLLASTTTNANGNYLFYDVVPGTYVVTAQATGYQVQAPKSVTVGSGEEVIVDFAMHEIGGPPPTPTPISTPGSTGNISGIVTDAVTGAGINGATVELDAGVSTLTGTVQGVDGVYAIAGVSVGQHVITAFALNYTSSSQAVIVVEGNPNPQTGANIFNINLGLISECGEYNIMSISTTKLKIKRNTSEEIVITSTQGTKTEDDVLVIKCPVEGMSVTTKIKDGGSKLISVLPEIIETDENGEAIFTIKAKNKKGNTKVYFYITEWGDWATMQLKVKVK